ncbi:DUF3618 domain-containing protein [Streptosporangiaceae bacterium NEAU-GS5]|nr:DUF3618 domain-containing protein [Streptosporangiaceae bacterium NEAU-GS5]
MADTDPEALERRIEVTRAELARTVDAIADRVSPKRVVERSVAKVKTNAEHLLASFGDFVGGGSRPSLNGSRSYAPGVHDELGEGPGPVRQETPPNIAPVLIGVGAVLVVGAAVVLFRRRRRG